MRKAVIKRKTKETSIQMELKLDGQGRAEISSPIGFLNHMLELLAHHGLFDLKASLRGDLEVDQHHLIEDTGIVLGQVFDRALKKRTGIARAGYSIFPMDEALALVAIDLSGRPYLRLELKLRAKRLGDFNTENLFDFFQGFVNGLGAGLHIKLFYGRSDHHKIEAIFKALARALKQACTIEPERAGKVPSTKGVL